MSRILAKTILRLFGWRIGSVGDDVKKCVICVAPHTSNWDFIIGKFFYWAIGRKANFLIKKEWYFFPFNLLFHMIGGIPVDRGQRTSTTQQMVEEFGKRNYFQLAITPEGTRKKTDDWKRGFYFIALEANVPILLAYIDYDLKEVGFMGTFYPTGDAEADIQEIRARYQHKTGRHPENFTNE
ncbi:lysophospholipid acyltransferase family protein [Parabacteroides sp. Marseille-P3160]|uniref:lysophospholipid acyltransferase family protein n=1 Tax=Parabacteroides sp. Marseille-P3160 TaxID=1917887 RepID=UPI0009B9AFDA|nr:lysophospholipid acyltransferase family protein [Parabacteroides sp. Marseille-P3160]